MTEKEKNIQPLHQIFDWVGFIGKMIVGIGTLSIIDYSDIFNFIFVTVCVLVWVFNSFLRRCE